MYAAGARRDFAVDCRRLSLKFSPFSLRMDLRTGFLLLPGFNGRHEACGTPGPAAKIEFTLVGVAAAFTNPEGQRLRDVASKVPTPNQLFAVRVALLDMSVRAGMAQPFARFSISVQ
jgi:hypothetical protein